MYNGLIGTDIAEPFEHGGRKLTVKAIVFTKYGPPDVLQLKEVAKPVASGSQVLVKVHASSINSWDWEYHSGSSWINRLFFDGGQLSRAH